MAYSYLLGILPRLGFFVEQRNRIPVDYDGIIAMLAPKPLLVITPTLDSHADYTQVQATMQKVAQVYNLLKASTKLTQQSPVDISRFSHKQQKQVADWLEQQVK